MVARSAPMHKHTADPPLAGLGNRDCHSAQRVLDNRARDPPFGARDGSSLITGLTTRSGRCRPDLPMTGTDRNARDLDGSVGRRRDEG
jgi:hypothetical protein